MQDITWAFLATRQFHEGGDVLRLGHGLGVLRVILMDDVDTTLHMLYEDAVYPDHPDEVKHAEKFATIAARKQEFGVKMLMLQGRQSPAAPWKEVRRLTGLIADRYNNFIALSVDSGGILMRAHIWSQSELNFSTIYRDIRLEQERLMKPLQDLANAAGKSWVDVADAS
ncbi:hypothetical protein RYA05_04365 [Pseudomonas syringae pv. actinidiae]|nr:hypothetical protein [Pseudomonas syringae pv. actinidiae]